MNFEALATMRLDAPGRLRTLGRTGLLDSQPEEVFDRPTRLASRLLQTPVALFSLVDADRQFFVSQVGLREPTASRRETPLSHSFCQHVVTSEEPLIVADARSDPRVQDNQAISDLGVESYLGVPIAGPDGQILGSFCVIGHEPREWGSDDVAMLVDIASGVSSEVALRLALDRAQVIENKLADALRDLEQSLRQRDRLLGDVNHRLRNSLSIVASLVRLEERSSPELKLSSLLRRVETVVETHGLLRGDDGFDLLALDDLMMMLGEHISTRLDRSAKVDVNCVAHDLNVDLASTLAVLSSEIMAGMSGADDPTARHFPHRLDGLRTAEGLQLDFIGPAAAAVHAQIMDSDLAKQLVGRVGGRMTLQFGEVSRLSLTIPLVDGEFAEAKPSRTYWH